MLEFQQRCFISNYHGRRQYIISCDKNILPWAFQLFGSLQPSPSWWASHTPWKLFQSSRRPCSCFLAPHAGSCQGWTTVSFPFFWNFEVPTHALDHALRLGDVLFRGMLLRLDVVGVRGWAPFTNSAGFEHIHLCSGVVLICVHITFVHCLRQILCRAAHLLCNMIDDTCRWEPIGTDSTYPRMFVYNYTNKNQNRNNV